MEIKLKILNKIFLDITIANLSNFLWIIFLLTLCIVYRITVVQNEQLWANCLDGNIQACSQCSARCGPLYKSGDAAKHFEKLNTYTPK